MSRFRATPSVPSSNSSSSLAMVDGRPSTRAIPSPASVTVPTSSRVVSGVYDDTYRSSAPRMSSEEMVSSAILSFLMVSGSGEGRQTYEPGVRLQIYGWTGPELGSLTSTRGQDLPSDSQAPGNRSVVEITADLDAGTAEHRRLHADLDRHLSTVHAAETLAELLLLGIGQRPGYCDV